jgi:hypothetical protein
MVSKVVMMRDSEQVERIRELLDSLADDQAERERLKREADEALARFQVAVRELIGESQLTGGHSRD